MKPNPLLFEIAWEVCNPVGGIYTYVTSKVPTMVETYGDDYLLIGPYFPEQVGHDFEELTAIEDPHLAAAAAFVQKNGFEIKYGHWLLGDAKPRVLLINPALDQDRLNALKARWWSRYYISSLDHDLLRDQSIAFGEAVRQLIAVFVGRIPEQQDIVLQYHDWLPSASIPDLIFEQTRVAIVFNAHATLLGRCLAAHEDAYFNHLPYYDWNYETQRFNITGRAALEREAARNAHVLVTNSEVTARECECFHGRTPDYIVRNGVDRKSAQTENELEEHLVNRTKIDDFVQRHFGQGHHIETKNTLYFFTAGRYEYFNKGFDITLAAIERLNWLLKERGSDIQVVFFIVSKQPHMGLSANAPASPQAHAHLDGESLPPVTTHQLFHDDEITGFLNSHGLQNQRDNPVKVIYHPDFIEASTSPLGLDYLDFVRGCHLGVFPSLYEPWGYAPMETALQTTPVVISDLSGFGRYIQSVLPPEQEGSVRVVYRRYHTDEEAIDRLTLILLEFIETYQQDHTIPRVHLDRDILDSLGWTELIRYYREIYRLALIRHQPTADLY